MQISRAVLAIGCLIAGGPIRIHHHCALGAALCMCRRSCTRLHSRRAPKIVRKQEERHCISGPMHCGALQRLCEVPRHYWVRSLAPLPSVPTNCCGRARLDAKLATRCTVDPKYVNGYIFEVRPLSPVEGSFASFAARSGRCKLTTRGSHRAPHTKPVRFGDAVVAVPEQPVQGRHGPRPAASLC